MDCAVGNTEIMKNIVAKGIQTEMGTPYNPSSGFVTEKLYMLLQVYLQNKGWNHEFLQYFSELKDPSIVPSAAYLQMMASRITLDSQGRLILRENGKIILPFEHFANAVMLKHMNGPHGLHLGMEATLRTVMESYTMGRENFGMEKEFVVEVVNNCPNPACRFYKTQLDLTHTKPTYIPEQSNILKSGGGGGGSSGGGGGGESVGGGGGGSSEAGGGGGGKGGGGGTPLPPSSGATPSSLLSSGVGQHKLSDFLKANIENFDSLSNANKDLLAVHNGSWSHETGSDGKRHSAASAASEVGQEKIVRAFSEIMKNMARMKTCIRPSMCKPYGKQSEALQKTLMDTVQLVQSLRSILPPPHIQVSSWKNEDKHSVAREAYSQGDYNLQGNLQGGMDRI